MKIKMLLIACLAIPVLALSQAVQPDELNQVKEKVAKMDKKCQQLQGQINTLKKDMASNTESLKAGNDETRNQIQSVNETVTQLKTELQNQQIKSDSLLVQVSGLKMQLYVIVLIFIILIAIVYFVMLAKIKKYNADNEAHHLQLHETRFGEMKTYVDKGLKDIESKFAAK